MTKKAGNIARLIEDYLDGQLSGKERKIFEEELSTNPELKKELELRIKTEQLWKHAHEYEDVKKQVASEIKNKTMKRPVFFNKNLLSIAASLLVLIAVSVIFFYSVQKHTDRELELIAADSSAVDTIISYESPKDLPPKTATAVYAKDEIVEKLILKFPSDNSVFNEGESIFFKWESLHNEKESLFILSDTLYEFEINLNDTVFKLEKQILPKGKYKWFIRSEEKHHSFTIK